MSPPNESAYVGGPCRDLSFSGLFLMMAVQTKTGRNFLIPARFYPIFIGCGGGI